MLALIKYARFECGNKAFLCSSIVFLTSFVVYEVAIKRCKTLLSYKKM